MPVNLKVSREIALMEAGHNAAPPRAGQVGLNHMARPIAGLGDLADLYNNLKEKEIKINRAPDHGLSPGIYLQDPDGNDIKVYYETPRGQWRRREKLFMSGDRPQGSFHRPWETDPLSDGVAANRG